MTTGQFYDHSQRLEDRDVSELIGIARGLVADGEFNEQEADFLVRWLREKEHVTCWPFNILHERVHALLEKGECPKRQKKNDHSINTYEHRQRAAPDTDTFSVYCT